MAGRDKTGPLGMGPRTGRGMGLCSDEDLKDRDSTTYGMRRGFPRGNRPFRRSRRVYGGGYRRGFGRGFRYGFVGETIAEETDEE